MPTDCLPFKDTGYFSKLILDYLAESDQLKSFYNRFPKLENFKQQIKDKQTEFDTKTRTILAETLVKQYKSHDVSLQTLNNIEALRNPNTFTITTGHQLNLFTGPLYFLYKIISTINLTKNLKATYPEYNFVPVYWMATEDHDFEEINYFNFNGKKLRWNKSAAGPVGELHTNGLEDVFNVFSQELGLGKNADTLRQWFKTAYLEHDNLAQSTLYLANQLFKDTGLVIIDANHKDLKQCFAPFVKKELFEQTSYKTVSKTNLELEQTSQDYKIQVNPREINLFYINDNLRERIVFEDNTYSVLNTKITWTKAQLEEEVNNYPERFSPNVILRPLYQEVILPNLCYIGGGGELAYWFQLKENFAQNNVAFPFLLLRNSVLLKTKQQVKKLEKLNISTQTLFLKRDTFINKRVREISNIDIDFSPQIKHLKKQFEALYQIAEQTDKSFLGAVDAQRRKQIKGLEHLEKRLLTAQKRKLKDHIERITDLQNQLFPNQSLQERSVNFSQFYLEYGDKLIKQLIQNLEPLNAQFLILQLEDNHA